MQCGPLEFDFERLRAAVNGRPVALSGLQLRLLAHLLRHPDCVLTREQLLADLWGASERRSPKAVDVVVCRLREKLGPAGHAIESVRNYGYRFRATFARADEP
jgi:DNA-binding response OmpR family regulator